MHVSIIYVSLLLLLFSSQVANNMWASSCKVCYCILNQTYTRIDAYFAFYNDLSKCANVVIDCVCYISLKSIDAKHEKSIN